MRRGHQRPRPRGQQRAGRRHATLNAQGQQSHAAAFEQGAEAYRAGNVPSDDTLAGEGLRDNRHAVSRSTHKKRFHLAAAEIAQIESKARHAVHEEVKALLREGKYGHAPRHKPNNSFRLMFENWNSLGVFTGERKIRRINDMVRQYEVDCLAGCEAQVDWRFAKEDERFEHLFGRTTRTRHVTANNTTNRKELCQRNQYGGTAMMTFGRLSGFVLDRGKDETNLGRWCWILVGTKEKKTRIVVAYQPCQPKASRNRGGTVFEQHETYFEGQGELRSPRTLFYEALVAQLLVWKGQGEDIVLCGDFNENVYDGRLARRLGEDDLLMTESCREVTGERLPATHNRGNSRAVCAVYSTAGAVPVNATVLEKHRGVGDHRVFIVDFTSESILGTVFPRVVRPDQRKLHCDSVRIREAYNRCLNQLLDRHSMFAKLNELNKIADVMSEAEFQIQMNRWDAELTDYMHSSENNCHKFKNCWLEYSPDANVWWQRRWLLGRIKRYLQGKVPDPRNLFRACRKAKLAPREMSIDDVECEIAHAHRKILELKLLAPEMRRKHLKKCLQRAKDKGDETKAAEILRILHKEANRKRHARIKYSTGKPPMGSVVSVKVNLGDGGTEEFNTKEGCFMAIEKNLSQRFRLAFTAPSCSGPLFDDIGFCGDTVAVQQILEGTYAFPPNTDPATRLLLEEAAVTYSKMSMDEVATYVTAEDYQFYWQRANERISSSYSGLHFGHYKAAAFDPDLSALHASKLSLCARKGVPLARWGRGLTVLLEKIMGNNYVHKLRAICLFEADFNWWTKLIFARRMMAQADAKGCIPDDLFAKKGESCDSAVMTKVFFSDISRTMHRPASLTMNDFGDCYDRSAHTVQAVALRANGIPKEAVRVMLTCLRLMQFFVRTGFGESEESFGGTEENPLGGLGMGSGSAPPSFAVLSVLIVNAYKRMGHGAKLTSAYMARMFLLAAVMWVDDTDLFHTATSPTTQDDEFVGQVQKATTDWGMLAQATGGVLKPEKCGAYFLSYKFDRGKPRLKKVRELPPPSASFSTKDGKVLPAHLTVPQPDGSVAPIPTFEPTDPAKGLGVHFVPAGNGAAHIREMKGKGLKWVDKITTRPLPSRDAWLSFYLSLYRGIVWGLVSVNMPPDKLESEIQSLYFRALPFLGVNRCITKEWRMLPERFQGLGMPNFVVECLAAKIFFLQRHLGFDDAAGMMMQQAWEAFLVEVGLYGDVLTLDFEAYGGLATDLTWFKTLWEYAARLRVGIYLAPDCQVQPVRQGDLSLMQSFRRVGFVKLELERLNRVRKFKCVLHLSDIVLCDGKSLDTRACGDAVMGHSAHDFPLEQPVRGDFALWDTAVGQLFGATGRLERPLGPYLREGHLFQHWFESSDGRLLFYRPHNDVEESYDEYHLEARRYPTRHGRRFALTATRVGTLPNSLRLASVVYDDSVDRVRLHSSCEPFRPIQDTVRGLLDTLQSFENQTLWRYFHCDGDGEWIRRGLIMGSLVIVHDGSYMPHVAKDVCSAAFIIYCTVTRQRCKGAIAERVKSADNYRGEILGGILVQLVLRAATQGRAVPLRPARVGCDNNGVVQHGNESRRGLKEKQAQADVLRSFKQLINDQRFEVVYYWVASHQDDIKNWSSLSLPERLNVIVDKLAKKMLIFSVRCQEFISSHLPFERVRVILDGAKMTGSPKTALTRHWGTVAAREFFHDQHIINKYDFNLVYWDGVEAAMLGFPKMFRVYVTKQASKFCGTNRQLSRIDPRVQNVCPSCGQDDESSKHITRCRERGRYKMWRWSVDDLVTWVARTTHDLVLTDMLREYLLSQGTKTMRECLHVSSTKHQLLADVHDRLGWDNFVEGRLCSVYLEFLPPPDSRPSRWQPLPPRWGREFSSRLMQATHKQWLYRNLHVHRKGCGGLTATQEDSIFQQVRDLMLTDPSDLLPKHRYLLTEDFNALGSGSTYGRQCWVAAMESAVSAAKIVQRRQRAPVVTGVPHSPPPTRRLVLRSSTSSFFQPYVYRHRFGR